MVLTSFKNKVKRGIKNYDRGGYFFKLVNLFIQRYILRQEVELRTLKSLNTYNSITELRKKSSYRSLGPKSSNKARVSEIVSLPALNLYKFRDGLVNARSNCIVVQGKLVYESYNSRERFNQGFVEWHDKKYAVVKTFPEEKIDDGFFLAGLGSYNWYHWLIEILPKAMFLDKIPTKNILVSEFVAKYPSMFESLKAVIGDKYNIIYLDSNKNYRVKDLYHINGISYVPFELAKGEKLGVRDVFMRGDILISMKEKIIACNIEQRSIFTQKKIFIERSRHRVPENQSQLLAEMAKLGFKNNNLENLTLADQIRLFYNAECIVGTTGAAFSNMMFAGSNTRFICFMPESLNEFSCFSNLANIFNVDLTYLFYELEEGKHHYSNEFIIDIDQVLNSVKKDLDC